MFNAFKLLISEFWPSFNVEPRNMEKKPQSSLLRSRLSAKPGENVTVEL